MLHPSSNNFAFYSNKYHLDKMNKELILNLYYYWYSTFQCTLHNKPNQNSIAYKV